MFYCLNNRLKRIKMYLFLKMFTASGKTLFLSILRAFIFNKEKMI